MRVVAFVSAAATLTLTACYPAFNWREVRPERTAFSMLLPCKPEKAEKTVPLGGKPASLTLLACDAGDITFAVSVAEPDNSVDAAALLAQWQDATLGNMKAEPMGTDAGATRAEAIKIAGAAVQPAAVLVRALGQRADGRAVTGHAAYFAQPQYGVQGARGPKLFQVVMYAEKIPPDVAETFFSSLKFE